MKHYGSNNGDVKTVVDLFMISFRSNIIEKQSKVKHWQVEDKKTESAVIPILLKEYAGPRRGKPMKGGGAWRRRL